MMLERPDRSDDDDGVRFQISNPAFDIEELFRSQVGTKSGFGNGISTHCTAPPPCNGNRKDTK